MAIEPIYDPKATTIPVLRYLVAVAEHRHFGRAAEACRISQPTLSALVAQWEKRMRLTVFERDQRSVRVTPAGERVVAAARLALTALQGVEQAAIEAKPPFYGPVRLGVIPTVGPYALPFISRALEQAFPELELPIRESTTDELLAALAGGTVDVALLAALPGIEARFTIERLYDEPFLAAFPRGHAFARLTSIDPELLLGERLLLLAEGHCLRDQALAVCGRTADAANGADYRATSLETLRQIVASGAGVTVLPALAQPEVDDRRLVVRPLTGDAHRTIVLCWRHGDRRSDAYRQLAAPIRRAIPRDQVRLAR